MCACVGEYDCFLRLPSPRGYGISAGLSTPRESFILQSEPPEWDPVSCPDSGNRQMHSPTSAHPQTLQPTSPALGSTSCKLWPPAWQLRTAPARGPCHSPTGEPAVSPPLKTTSQSTSVPCLKPQE